MKEEITLVIPLGFGREVEYLEGIQRQNIEMIKEFGTNTSENRNKGAEKVKTRYIGFINGHTELDESWKEEVIKFFKEYPEIDIVGGPQLTPESEEGFAKISGYALCSKFGAAGLSLRYAPGKLNLDADEKSITSANLICKKEVFNKIKFDENIYPGEDPKFIEDAKKAGLRVAYTPDIITYNKRRKTVRGLIKQIASYGKTRTQKESFWQTLKTPFFLVPSLFCIYLMLAALLVMLEFFNVRLISNFLLLLPLLLYLDLAFLFSIYDSIVNKNILAMPVLFFIFPMIHLSYGFGMIWGYLKKKKNQE